MGRRRRDRLELNAEINVVSLIDVMLLLLVIFMITAPMMQGGVDLALPKADAKPLESKGGMVISIERSGQLLVDDTRMSYSEFRAALPSLASRSAREGVYVRADTNVPFGDVLRVIAVMTNAGIRNVGFMAEPEKAP